MKYKFSIWRTASCLGLLCITAFYSIQMSVDYTLLIDWPFVIAMVIIPFLLAMLTLESEFIRFIPHAIAILFCRPSQPCDRFARIALFLGRTIIGVAVCLTLFEMISMLRYMPSPESIGAAMALALLPMLYGVLVSEVYLAMVYQSFKDQDTNSSSKSWPLNNAILPMFTVFLMISVFAWLCLSTIGVTI